MVKRFFRDSVIYGLANLLSGSIGFVLIPLYTRVFSPLDYGIIDILGAFASLAGVTVALEISQSVARFFPEAETDDHKTAYASTALWFTLAAYSVLMIGGIAGARPLSALLLDSQERQSIFQVAVVSTWATGLFYLVQNQLRWELKPVYFAIASIVNTVIALGSTLALVLGLHMGVISVFWGQLIGGASAFFLGIYLVRARYQLRFDVHKFAEMLRFSLPLVPSSIGVFVTLYIDRFAIKSLMTLSDVGLFGIGYRIASIAGLVMVAFQGSLIPLIYHNYRDFNTPFELARIFRYFMGLALLICLGLGLFAPEILRVVTTIGYYSGAKVVPLLAPAILLSSMYIFAPGLAIAKRTGLMAVFNVFSAAENTLLNFWLIPLWGIMGAAAATLISAATLFAAYMVASQRLYRVPHAWGPIGVAALVVIAAECLGGYLPAAMWSGILVKIVLMLGSGFTFVVFGLVDSDELKGGLRQLQRLWPSRIV